MALAQVGYPLPILYIPASGCFDLFLPCGYGPKESMVQDSGFFLFVLGDSEVRTYRFVGW